MSDVQTMLVAFRVALAGAAFGGCTAHSDATPEQVPAEQVPPDQERSGTPNEPPREQTDPIPLTCEEARWCGSAQEAVKLLAPGAAMPSAGACPEQSTLETQRLITAARGSAVPRPDAGDDPSGACCYVTQFNCMGGRALVQDDVAVTAQPQLGGDWQPSAAPAVATLCPTTRAALAAAWVADALAEHASIASFARATLELLAVAAPADLVRDSIRCASDEVHHAALCFGLATAYGAGVVGPGPLAPVAPRTASLAQVARDVLIEACLGETTAALIATRAARTCSDPAVAEILRRIAEDETRHAALGWRVLAWTLQVDPHHVRPVLSELAIALERGTLTARIEPTAADFPEHGRLGPVASQQAATAASLEIARPLLASLLRGDWTQPAASAAG